LAVRIRFPNQADFNCPRQLVVEAEAGGCSVIDLSATSFVKPLGIALLHGLITHIRNAGDEVEVKVSSDDVATYLWRMNLHSPFAADGGVRFNPDIKHFTLSRWPKQLLELTIVDVANDDEVVTAEEHTWSMIARGAPQYGALRDPIRTAVVELISNVERHSGTGRASVIAQTHKDCVRIAVGDVGIGVRESLERTGTHDLQGKSDHEVLRYATQPGITASPGHGGMGLATIADAIRLYGRAVHLASGRGVFSVFRGRESGADGAFAVPGTIVEVAFERPP